jgi:hypothetical protein
MANRKMAADVLSLADFEQQAIEALGQTPGKTIRLDNGESVTIPHPMLVSDEQQARIEAVENDDDLNLDEDGKINGQRPPSKAARLARAVLGEEQHARFIAGGGKSNHVMLAWNWLVKSVEAEQDPKLPR